MWALVLLALASAPKPLVVVLHGDREHARDAAARWRTAVDAHGWVLLALDVPAGDSWWRWNGDPQWVIDHANAIAHDPARTYLVGWSGGATYIGMHASAWRGTFAAVVLHGGGMAPDDATCTDLPAYFLVGDRNPLHALAKDLRAYFDGCHDDVVWDLVKGADHAREERALTRAKANAILDWLSTKRLAD
ncbi:MAG TPA: PHB depolymerase family esterase [Kofleriaceae bacterium]|nr:PHB depolymerase family esterase [Kofleriaceae bacterium]